MLHYGCVCICCITDVASRVQRCDEVIACGDAFDAVYSSCYDTIKESEGERGGGMFAHQNMKEHRNKIKVSFEALCAFPTPEDSDPHTFQAEGVEEEDEVAAKYGDANL